MKKTPEEIPEETWDEKNQRWLREAFERSEETGEDPLAAFCAIKYDHCPHTDWHQDSASPTGASCCTCGRPV